MDGSRALSRDEIERFVLSLDDYQPAIPDELVRHYLSRSGFMTDDVRVERLVALAAQKFLADIANDALAYSRLRTAAMPAPSSRAKGTKEARITLTIDDLERALREYGVSLRKPAYFADSTTAGVADTASSPQTASQGTQATQGAATPRASASAGASPQLGGPSKTQGPTTPKAAASQPAQANTPTPGTGSGPSPPTGQAGNASAKPGAVPGKPAKGGK